MTDHDQLLETVAVHIQWLRRPRPLLQSQADHLQSADYLEQLAAALRAALATQPELVQVGWLTPYGGQLPTARCRPVKHHRYVGPLGPILFSLVIAFAAGLEIGMILWR